MPETVYHDQDGVLVTNVRFTCKGHTYPIGQIRSVRLKRTLPPNHVGIFLIAAGVVSIVAGLLMSLPSLGIGVGAQVPTGTATDPAGLAFIGLADVVAVGILTLGIVLVRRRQPVYIVHVTMAEEEVDALGSRDSLGPERVVEALKRALGDGRSS